MDIREIVVGLGIVAIGLIIWDGMRRMKAAKPKKAVVEDEWVDPEEVARKAELARELPNGGARIRTMTSDEQVELKSKLNLRERVPMLMERVEVETPSSDNDDDLPVKDLQSELDFSIAMSDYSDEEDIVSAQHVNQEQSDIDDALIDTSPIEHIDEMASQSETGIDSIDPAADDIEVIEPDDEMLAAAQAVAHEHQSVEVVSAAETELETADDPGPVEDLVIVHVMAPNKGELSGSLLLDLLITAGLRHGPMNIFHYRNPQGITEFSLANCIQPGTFDPDAMNQVNTPGVTLFMQLPTAADALESFGHMIEMAKFLAKNLDAVVLDEDHSSVTGQRIEYYREKIRAFERSKLIPS